jgi:hypothetical protein
MSLQPGMTVTGKITFKATRLIPDPDLSRARLTLSPVQTQGVQRISLGVPVAQVEPNGQFRITGVTPGRYRLNGTVPLPQGSGPGPGWTMLSAVAKGQDVLDFAIDIGPNDEDQGRGRDVHRLGAGGQRQSSGCDRPPRPRLHDRRLRRG